MRSWHKLRVFTTLGEGGNLLAVVLGTEGLDESQMARAAEEIAFSETVFVEFDEEREQPRARIFTPKGEIAFAGHPLIGVAWLIDEIMPERETDRIETFSGVVEAWRDGSMGWIRTAMPPITPGPENIFPTLGHLGAEAVDLTPRMPPAFSGHGQPYLILPFAEPDRVRELKPDFSRLARDKAVPHGVYCFAIRESELTARFFAPAMGIEEDPGTGSAAVALSSYLIRFQRLAPRVFWISQGAEVGAACLIHVRIEEELVAVGGEVALDGEFPVPG